MWFLLNKTFSVWLHRLNLALLTVHVLKVFLFSCTCKRPLEQISAPSIKNVKNGSTIVLETVCPAYKPNEAPVFQICFHIGCISLVVQPACGISPSPSWDSPRPSKCHSSRLKLGTWTWWDWHSDGWSLQRWSPQKHFALKHLLVRDTSMTNFLGVKLNFIY